MKKGLKLLALSLSAMGLFSCESYKVYTQRVYAFSTFLEMKISTSDAKIVEEAESIIQYYDALADSFKGSDEYTNVYEINQTNDQVEVSKDLYDVLYLADSLKEDTNGYYSPYLFNLSSLYKEDFAKGIVPSAEEVSALLNEANGTSLSFETKDGSYFVKRNGNGGLDLGGIAKGACLDALYDLFKENGLTYYLISAQSSILMGEKNYSPSYFKIALKDKPRLCFRLANCSLATSAITEQRYDIDGKTYSHIIDPHNGSAEAKRTAAIVAGGLNENAKMDAYSTAMMSMSDEEIASFVSTKNLKAFTIDGEATTSYGLETYVL